MSSNHKQPLKKVVLAYSGGLDTSVIVPWLRQTYGCEVICFCANVGQGEAELDGLYERAISSGASKCYIEDLRQEFAKDFLFPLLQSGALYEGVYPLGSAISRPLIAKWLVAFAEAEGATAVAHGCTGLGNDQVRFELAIKARNPKLQIIAPWREWSIRSRADLLAYAAEHKVAVPDNDPAPFSRDRNLWHTSHEGGSLENPATAPAESLFEMTVAPEAAPDEPELVKISFERGLPMALNDVPLTPAKLITQLNEIAGRHGVG
ncbi:MAG: argininosuccinate synthase, partial [Anaerolineales bacterium]|nr:argininosuccinate synthase [Anaerolineales bacterium]